MAINYLKNLFTTDSKEEATSPFLTKAIRPRDYPKIAEIALCWEKAAEDKRKQAENHLEKEQFQSCAKVSGWVAQEILNKDYTSSLDTYACKDTKGRIQGLMMLMEREEDIYINLLVVNPIHIRSPVNEGEIGRMRGIGTHLLKIAEKLAFQKRKEGILLASLPSSVPFYLNNGFTLFCPNSCEMAKTVVTATPQKTRSIFERLVA